MGMAIKPRTDPFFLEGKFTSILSGFCNLGIKSGCSRFKKSQDKPVENDKKTGRLRKLKGLQLPNGSVSKPIVPL
jgi:hypothetical protein